MPQTNQVRGNKLVACLVTQQKCVSLQHSPRCFLLCSLLTSSSSSSYVFHSRHICNLISNSLSRHVENVCHFMYFRSKANQCWISSLSPPTSNVRGGAESFQQLTGCLLCFLLYLIYNSVRNFKSCDTENALPPNTNPKLTGSWNELSSPLMPSPNQLYLSVLEGDEWCLFFQW